MVLSTFWLQVPWRVSKDSPLGCMLITSSAALATRMCYLPLLSTRWRSESLGTGGITWQVCCSSALQRLPAKRMTEWRNANAGCSWAVKLDACDLGGHLDVTQRALAGTLSLRVKESTAQVITVGALCGSGPSLLFLSRAAFATCGGIQHTGHMRKDEFTGWLPCAQKLIRTILGVLGIM